MILRSLFSSLSRVSVFLTVAAYSEVTAPFRMEAIVAS
jgi:hypothetical protein